MQLELQAFMEGQDMKGLESSSREFELVKGPV